MLEKSVKKFLPPHWQGVAIDAVFVLLNLFLLPLLGSRLERLFQSSFQNDDQAFLILAVIIFVVFFWRFVALYVKRVSVQHRLEDEEDVRSVGCLWFLNLSSVVLSGAFLIVLITIIFETAGFKTQEFFAVVTALIGLAFIIIELILLYRLTRPLEDDEIKTARNQNPLTELFADAGLFAYMFVWQAFYNFYLASITPNSLTSMGIFIATFILSAIVFVMFYLGPRSVFLLEDAGYKSTWLSISLVFLASFASHQVFDFFGI